MIQARSFRKPWPRYGTIMPRLKPEASWHYLDVSGMQDLVSFPDNFSMQGGKPYSIFILNCAVTDDIT